MGNTLIVLREGFPGQVYLGKLSNLRFVDVTTFIALKKREMVKLLRGVVSESNKVELKVKKKRIKGITVDRFYTFQLENRLNCDYELVDSFILTNLTQIWKDLSIFPKIKPAESLVLHNLIRC